MSDENPIKPEVCTEVSTDTNPQGPRQSQMVIGKTIKDTRPLNEEVIITLNITWQHLKNICLNDNIIIHNHLTNNDLETLTTEQDNSHSYKIQLCL